MRLYRVRVAIEMCWLRPSIVSQRARCLRRRRAHSSRCEKEREEKYLASNFVRALTRRVL